MLDLCCTANFIYRSIKEGLKHKWRGMDLRRKIRNEYMVSEMHLASALSLI